jgi:hypothetical protein
MEDHKLWEWDLESGYVVLPAPKERQGLFQ